MLCEGGWRTSWNSILTRWESLPGGQSSSLSAILPLLRWRVQQYRRAELQSHWFRSRQFAWKSRNRASRTVTLSETYVQVSLVF